MLEFSVKHYIKRKTRDYPYSGYTYLEAGPNFHAGAQSPFEPMMHIQYFTPISTKFITFPPISATFIFVSRILRAMPANVGFLNSSHDIARIMQVLKRTRRFILQESRQESPSENHNSLATAFIGTCHLFATTNRTSQKSGYSFMLSALNLISLK